MAYIPPQLAIDTERENQRIGFLNQAMGSFADIAKTRQAALEKEKAQKDAMKAEANDLASKGVSGDMIAEAQKSGDYGGIRNLLAENAKTDQAYKRKITEADATKKIYDANQTQVPVEQRDDTRKAQLVAQAQEQTRIGAEERSKQREAEGKKYEAVDNIRKEITSHPATKAITDIDTAYSKINSAPESAAGDMSLIFNFMKIQDPGSTVREGEYANAENARGIDGAVQQAYNKVLSGQKLTPQQREDFKKSAGKLAYSQYKTYQSVTEPHRNRIKELGVDENQILPRFSQQSTFDSFKQKEAVSQKLQGLTPEQKQKLYQDLKMKQQSSAGRGM